MADNTIIGKRKDAYRNAEKKYKADNAIRAALRALNNAIPPRKRKTPLSQEELEALRTQYKNAITVITKRIEKLDEDYAKLVGQGNSLSTTAADLKKDADELKKNNARKRDQRVTANNAAVKANNELIAKNKSDKEKNKAEFEYFSKLRKTMSKDLKVLELSLKSAKYPTVTQLYELSRSNTAEYKMSEARKYGGGMSERYKISIKGEKNKKIDGFFTASRKGKKLMDAVSDFNKLQVERYGAKAESFNDADGRYLIESIMVFNREFTREAIFNSGKLIIDGADYMTMMLKINELKDFFDKCKDTRLTQERRDKCKNILNDKIKNTDDYMAFIDILGGVSKLNNAYGIMKDAGVNSLSKVDRRNSAMSMMADAIGCGKLLARSTNLRVKDKDTGKVISGTFMENAEGVDINGTNIDGIEKMKNLSPNKAEGMNQLVKNIANLQILDWLCGNVDRHSGNIFYKFDKEGRLCGIVGIDNDTCFGRNRINSVQSAINLENMMIIPKETAQLIEAMDEEQIKLMLYGYDINSVEVKNALGRFKELKQKLKEDKEYFADKEMGYIEEGRIKIVTDDEIGKLSLFAGLSNGKPLPSKDGVVQGNKIKNLFQTISGVCSFGFGLTNSMRYLKKEAYDLSADLLKASKFDLKKLDDAMNTSNQKTINGSDAFNQMKNSVKKCADTIKSSISMLVSNGRGGTLQCQNFACNEINDKLNTALKKVDDYLKTKNAAKILKKSKTSNAYIRYKLAVDTKKQLESYQKKFNKVLENVDKYNELNYDREAAIDTYNKEINEIKERNRIKVEPVKEEPKKGTVIQNNVSAASNSVEESYKIEANNSMLNKSVGSQKKQEGRSVKSGMHK